MDIGEAGIEKLGQEKILIGKELISRLDQLIKIPGVAKIQKKISAEVSSLLNAISLGRLTINHILCSNLNHFAYLVKTLEETEDVQYVDFPIKKRGDKKTYIRVDVVANEGRTWIKVIARNPKALNDIALGRSNYGAKSILDHAECFSFAADDNLQYFTRPKVIFDFANQIDDDLKYSLSKMQILVHVNRIPQYNSMIVHEPNVNKLNIDVTAMMAFVSNLTCETCNLTFRHKILNDQALQEQKQSTKAILDKFFQDKELIICETAKESFLNILDIVGGRNEKLRGKQFLDSITVLPDLNECEENAVWFENQLQLGKKIQKRTYKILTFGIFHKAITVTANKGAIEAAKMQGIFIPSFIHEARALSEQKQLIEEHTHLKL